MDRGIVMEIDVSDIIVLTPKGRFARIPLDQRSCQIGEEITFTEVKPRARKPWIISGSFVAFAAAVLLLLVNLNPGTTITVNKQIVAYVSIDINPSVELGIDEHNIVLEIRGLNEDGTELIKNLDFAGKHIDNFTEDLLQEAEINYLSRGQGDIIISSTMGENGNSNSQINDIVLSNQLKNVAIQHIEKTHPEQTANYHVTAFAADKEVRKVAESKGLSAGKYTIYLNAKNKGQDTSIEELKKESVHAIAKKAGGIDKLIVPEDLTKEKINKLLKEDESGDLDRKLSKRKNDIENKAKNKQSEDVKNSGKDDEVTSSSVDNKNNKNNSSKNNNNNSKENDRFNSKDNNWDNSKENTKETSKENTKETSKDKDNKTSKESKNKDEDIKNEGKKQSLFNWSREGNNEFKADNRTQDFADSKDTLSRGERRFNWKQSSSFTQADIIKPTPKPSLKPTNKQSTKNNGSSKTRSEDRISDKELENNRKEEKKHEAKKLEDKREKDNNDKNKNNNRKQNSETKVQT